MTGFNTETLWRVVLKQQVQVECRIYCIEVMLTVIEHRDDEWQPLL